MHPDLVLWTLTVCTKGSFAHMHACVCASKKYKCMHLQVYGWRNKTIRPHTHQCFSVKICCRYIQLSLGTYIVVCPMTVSGISVRGLPTTPSPLFPPLCSPVPCLCSCPPSYIAVFLSTDRKCLLYDPLLIRTMSFCFIS